LGSGPPTALPRAHAVLHHMLLFVASVRHARLLLGGAASAEMEAVIAHKEELKRYVTMLTDVLKEASEEITSLKARANASAVEAKEARRALHDRLREDVDVHARLAALQAAAGESGASAGAGMSVDTAGSAAAPAGAFATPVAGGGDGGHTVLSAGAGSAKHVAQELQALRDNYHQALRTNEALRGDVEELQQQVASLEDKLANSAPLSAKARSRSITGAIALSTVAEEDGSGGATPAVEKITFEVVENERKLPLGGWSAQTLPTDPCVVSFPFTFAVPWTVVWVVGRNFGLLG
jgi:hypothetical protein